MKRVFCALFWAGGLTLAGIAAMLGYGFALFSHQAMLHVGSTFAVLGAGIGLNLFALAFCFAKLPGARRPPALPQPFGVAQGLWGIAGFAVMMANGYLLLTNLLTLESFALLARHSRVTINFTSDNFMLCGVVAGELSAALWVVWYLRRLGAARLADGGATGIAWRAAPRGAYTLTVLTAVGIVGVEMLLFHFIPPDMKDIADLPEAQLFTGGGWTVLPLLLVVLFAAPVLEEIVFRGIAFAGLATRMGPLWAGVATTALFMAVHAPEKLYYPPGFLDVGLLAAAAVALRVKYRSIRPGILLHILYNTGSMLAAAMLN